MLEQSSKGTSYQRIDDESILTIKVPLLKESIQEKIKLLVYEDYNLKQISKRLLKKAKKMIDEKIDTL